MKKLLANGYKMSIADRLAIENDLNESLEEWAKKGPKYMVTEKPVKELLKKELSNLRAEKIKERKSLTACKATCVCEICKMPSFKPKKHKWEGLIKPNRKQERTETILADGIDVIVTGKHK